MTPAKRRRSNAVPEKAANPLIKAWQAELAENPRFQNAGIHSAEFDHYGRELLGQITTLVEKIAIPEFDAKSLEPLFRFWRKVRQSHQAHGLSSKETALLIFSLRSGLSRLNKEWESSGQNLDPHAQQLTRLLDLMGLLTFEAYSTEQEQIIARQTQQIQALEENQGSGDWIETKSPVMRQVLVTLKKVSQKDVAVLLEGESGVGKDVLARHIHAQSTRRNGPFIAVNCGAIPKDLVESELFGHEKGAFTGASERRLGKFELAHGGTIFLDEVGELDLHTQVKLLRVLQNKEIERVGGSEKVPVDFRVIAATNRDLQAAVKAKTFRLDLFYRIHVFPVKVPALRERKQDILPLAQFFIKKYAETYATAPSPLTPDASQYLLRQPWEGNIRELENCMQRAVILANGQAITAAVLTFQPSEFFAHFQSEPAGELSSPNPQIEPLTEIEARAIRDAIAVTKGNIRQAAQALGISRTTLYAKAKQYEIELEQP